LTWRNLEADELEYQFNPRRTVPDFESHQARNAKLSAAVRARLEGYLDIAYGETPLQRIDLFPAAPQGKGPAPIHVFFHGGYWRAQDKANFAFVAEHLVAKGICTVIANYDLCPAVTLDGVVASARKALAWTWRHAADYGADPEHLTISGSSAGAHLQAMALAHDWTTECLPADLIKGAVPISGIYDPEPAMHTTVNADIRLTAAIARRNNALTLPPRARCPVALFVGADESREWRRQTELYAAHLRRHGLKPEVTEVPDAHHFSILEHYRDPESAILRAIVAIAHQYPHRQESEPA
jgi:arylformamidase